MGTSKKLQRRDKNRNAQGKGKRFRPLPRLYWVDKLIYIVLILLPCILFILLFAKSVDHTRILIEEGKALAVYQPRKWAGAWALILLFFAAVLPGLGLSARQTIFGIPHFTYGRAGGMRTDCIPLVQKPTSKASSSSRRLAVFVLALMVVCMGLSVYFSRLYIFDCWELQTDGISHYNAEMRATERLRLADMESYRLSLDRNGTKKTSRTFYVELMMETVDGQKLFFDFRNVDSLVKIDTRLRELGCKRSTKVHPLVWEQMSRDKAFPEDEIQILADLLGVTTS